MSVRGHYGVTGAFKGSRKNGYLSCTELQTFQATLRHIAAHGHYHRPRTVLPNSAMPNMPFGACYLSIHPCQQGHVSILPHEGFNSSINLDSVALAQEMLTAFNSLKLCIRAVLEQFDLFLGIGHTVYRIGRSLQPKNRASNIVQATVEAVSVAKVDSRHAKTPSAVVAFVGGLQSRTSITRSAFEFVPAILSLHTSRTGVCLLDNPSQTQIRSAQQQALQELPSPVSAPSL